MVFINMTIHFHFWQSLNEQALVRTEQWLYPFQVQLERNHVHFAHCRFLENTFYSFSICRTNHLYVIAKENNKLCILKLAFLLPLHILVQNILGWGFTTKMAVAARSLVLYSNNAKEFCVFKWQNSIPLPGSAYLSVSGTVLIKLAPHFVMELMDKTCHGDQLSLIFARGFFWKKLQRLLLSPVVFKHKGLFFRLLARSK